MPVKKRPLTHFVRLVYLRFATPHIRLPAAWNVHDKRQTPDTNCSITDQLLADWSRGRASCAQSSRSTHLRAADADCCLTDLPASVNMGLEVAESLPAVSGEDWLCWRSLNRLRTGVGRAKTVMRRWGYLDDAQSVDCDCGEPQTMAHLLSCLLLDEACTDDDLATVTERAKAYARKWGNIVWRTRQKRRPPLRPLDHVSIPQCNARLVCFGIWRHRASGLQRVQVSEFIYGTSRVRAGTK